MNQVLVTGVSGFLGGHVALQLLAQGYEVLGSVREPGRMVPTRDALGAAGADLGRLTLCTLDLLSDAGWREAASHCRFTVHVASPLVTAMPKDPDALIRPAIEGTERAVRAAFEAGHERIVLTSSLSAVDAGHRDYARTLSEADWTDVDGPWVTAYIASKTRAERRAWALSESLGDRKRLVVINPGTMLGPLWNDDPGTSGEIVRRMLRGTMPMAPNMILDFVDVRDVAAAHVAALVDAGAAGKRHILSEGSLSLLEVAQTLGGAFPDLARRLPRREMPAWLARLFMLWDAGLRDSRAFLGIHRRIDRRSGPDLLRRALVPVRDAAVATGHALLTRGLVR